ncbi:ABC transporter ATP-binding protein [Streptomyces silvisoli]|uniref:ABC transporter ATP-binding protein n=1 Tax=Streptomyces silvisoli TaxID=3034235 RepID=A0ABT5ZPF4_9ACTN|nr:ABC transporter ATP-binding protein [Streptomyces silvisoli]MDF3291596.1 ABC transporter ATP-binding protein [Streptomyces silvisoli]
MTMHPVQLRVDRLVKSFSAHRALEDVSLEVGTGRFLVLLGPSGSGKTTLLRCLAGIERPDGGSIRLGGVTLTEGHTHLPPERRDLAMVFQDYALWPHMTATANVGYALRRRRLERAEADRRVAALLERVGLTARADRYPHQLSGGEQQRVALARALVAEPGLLLFDEPLSNLDADLRERLRVEIATLTRGSGATVVYITHDQAEAFALADEIGVLESGRLVQHGAPEDIYHRPASPFVARFTGLAGELTGRVEEPGEGGRVVVRTDAGPVTASAPTAPVRGAAVRVLVRPAAVTLDGGADPAPDAVEGTVVDTAYRGRGYDHVVELVGGARLVEVFTRHGRPRGSTVRLRFDPEGCFTFPEQAPTEADAQVPVNAAPMEVV